MGCSQQPDATHVDGVIDDDNDLDNNYNSDSDSDSNNITKCIPKFPIAFPFLPPVFLAFAADDI